MSGRVVLLGASGHTGRLVAAHLDVDEVVLVGRDRARAEAVAAALPPDASTTTTVRSVDVRAPGALDDLVERGDVVVSTVGPFGLLGEEVVRTCLRVGAHYLDPSADAAFLRDLFGRLHVPAREAGCALVPGLGFESAPGNLLANRLLDEVDGADRLEVVYVCDPAVASRGTRLSVLQALGEAGHDYQHGLREVAVGAHRRRLTVAGRRLVAVSIPTTDALVLPRTHPRLSRVRAYLAGLGWMSRPLATVARVAGTDGAAPARRAIETLVERAAERPASRGVHRRVAPGLVAVAAGRCLSPGPRASGALGPVEAFGAGPLGEVLRHAGMHDLPAHAVGIQPRHPRPPRPARHLPAHRSPEAIR